MENLFHSKDDGLVFWVSGYDCSSQKVDDIAKYLKEKGDKFIKETGVSPEDVKTFIVTVSRRYKRMRVFFAEGNCDSAYQIEGTGWDMWSWLEN